MAWQGENCWEFNGCGREPGGDRVDELGVCPAAIDASLDGTNSGKNAGRFCWVAVGTSSSDGELRGTFARKLRKCEACSFYQRVMAEQGDSFVAQRPALATCTLGGRGSQ